MNRSTLRTSLTVLLAALAIMAVGAGTFQSAMSIKIPKVQIADAWARVGLEGGNSAIYLKLTNNQDQDLTLIGAETDVAQATELHETTIGPDHVMRMEHIHAIELAANETVEFQPGGLHVMLIGLDKPLHEGDEILLRLIFEGYDPLSIAVKVQHGDGLGDHGHDH